jgi:ribonuclease P protein component
MRSQADFAAVRKEGRRHFGAAFVLSVRRRPAPPAGRRGFDLPRFAVIASRRVGPAVTRNLLKRRLREIFRENQTLFPADVDVVVVLQPKAVGHTFDDLRREFLGAARRMGFTAPAVVCSDANSGAGASARASIEPASGDGGP